MIFILILLKQLIFLCSNLLKRFVFCFFQILHRHSYSLLSITLPWKEFLFNLSKGLIVCRSFSICFLYLLFLFKIILCNTLLYNDRVHTFPAKIGKIIRPTPATDRVIEVDVAPIITIVSSDSNIVFRVFFHISFLLNCFYLWIK